MTGKPRIRRSPAERALQGVRIVFEDADILVVDKPSGLLTIATEVEKERTAYHAVTTYVKRGQTKSRARVFIVHRLDRDTSGLIVFARTTQAKQALQSGWEETQKVYVAAVDGLLPQSTGIVVCRLVESAPHRVVVTHDPSEGKLARTGYRVVRADGRRSLVELDLLTGRRHQIRVHMALLGAPILGDAVYGTGKATDDLALHASALAFDHPRTGARLDFRTPIPPRIARAVGAARVEA